MTIVHHCFEKTFWPLALFWADVWPLFCFGRFLTLALFWAKYHNFIFSSIFPFLFSLWFSFGELILWLITFSGHFPAVSFSFFGKLWFVAGYRWWYLSWSGYFFWNAPLCRIYVTFPGCFKLRAVAFVCSCISYVFSYIVHFSIHWKVFRLKLPVRYHVCRFGYFWYFQFLRAVAHVIASTLWHAFFTGISFVLACSIITPFRSLVPTYVFHFS